jgi:hypothetical protein
MRVVAKIAMARRAAEKNVRWDMDEHIAQLARWPQGSMQEADRFDGCGLQFVWMIFSRNLYSLGG